MIPRTLAMLCICWVLTPAQPALGQGLPLADCKKWEVQANGARRLNEKEGFLKERVWILCDDTEVYADEISWDETMLRAHGNLLVVQDGLRVTAERVEMDRKTRLATFYKAVGTARLTDRAVEKSMFGTLEPEISFSADKLERLGPRKYRLSGGWFSTCAQANPRWDIRGSSGSVVLDERVILKNALLRVKSVPVIYIPVIYYPLGEDDRSTGFLLPTYTQSALRGHGISNAFFWAINRSQDATFYHDYSSKSGQGAGAEYRFISSPNSRGNLYVFMMDEPTRFAPDGALERSGRRSYRTTARLNQSFGRLRAIATVDYATDMSTQQLYQQDVFDASRRTRSINGNISGNWGRYRLTAKGELRDLFTTTTTAIRSGRIPEVDFSIAPQGLKRSGFLSRVYVGMNTQVSGIRNQSDISQSSTNLGLWRFDAQPTIRAPLFGSIPFMAGTISSSWRLTHWTESLNPLTGTPVPEPITRPMTEVRIDVSGPKVARIFQTPKLKYAERFKHEIEPSVSLQWLSPFNRFTEVVRNDYHIDCIVGGNSTVNYSLNTQLWARRRQEGGPGPAREIFRVGVSQSYYTTPAAASCDTQYRTATGTSTSNFSPIQLRATVSPTDATSGQFQLFIDSRTKAVQSYTASMSAFGRVSQVSASWSKRQFLPDVPGFDNPAFAAHFVNGRMSLNTPGRRFGGTYGFNLDVKNREFLEQRVSAFYNAQCCGIAVDYQVYRLANFTGLQQDHRFNFSFTLAGIGSFSNPLGSFGR